MSKEVFKANPSLQHYFQTNDGNKFYTEHDARAHAKKLKNKKVVKVEKEDVAEEKTKPLNVNQRIKVIKELTSVEKVELAVKDEQNERVLEAATKKIEELTPVKE